MKKPFKQCKKGYSCGFGCISRSKKCSDTKSKEATDFIKGMVTGIKMRGGNVKDEVKNAVGKRNTKAGGGSTSAAKPKAKPTAKLKSKSTAEPATMERPKTVIPESTVKKGSWRDGQKFKTTDFNGDDIGYERVEPGTYKNGDQKIVVKENDEGSYDVEIDGVSKRRTSNLSRELVAKTIDEQTAPVKKDVENVGEKASKLREGEPIKTQEEFEKVAEEAFDAIDSEKNKGGLVPIYALRRAMGERLTREEFDNFLLEMQANDKFQLEGGSVDDSEASLIADSVETELDGLRTYASRPRR